MKLSLFVALMILPLLASCAELGYAAEAEARKPCAIVHYVYNWNREPVRLRVEATPKDVAAAIVSKERHVLLHVGGDTFVQQGDVIAIEGCGGK